MGALLGLPALLLLIALVALPCILVVGLSFTDWQLGNRTADFAGLANYRELFADRLFWIALRNTLVYTAVVVPGSVLLGLGLALLIESAGSLRAFYRTVFFLPATATLIAMAVVWQFLLHPTFGWITLAAQGLGLPAANWLNDPATALPTLCAIGIWQLVGFNVVLFVAGLQAIPDDLYQATLVDGARTGLDRFLAVTWPLLGPTTLFVAVITAIRSFQVFDTVQVLTQGGPNNATEVLLHSIYQESFTFLRTSYGAAMTVVFLALVLALTLTQVLLAERRVHYAGAAQTGGGLSRRTAWFGPLGSVLRHLVLAGAALLVLVPFAFMLTSSFKSPSELFSAEFSLLPRDWYGLENYALAFAQAPLLRYLLNGVIVVGGILACQLAVNLPCGYALAKLPFRGRGAVFGAVLFALLIPPQVTAIPLFVAFYRIGILDSYAALILPWTVSAFGVFLFRQYFKTVPDDLLSAARLDGCSELSVLWRVMVPAAFPAIVAFSIFSVVAHWNDYFWPLIIVASDQIATPPLGIVFFRNAESGSDYGPLMAGAVVITAPLLIAFLLAQRWFVRGIALAGR